MRRAIGAIIMAFALVNLPTGAPQAAEQFQQAKLESFVNAALAVNRLVQQWTPKIQSAQNETEATQMREQANRELVAAIQQSDGITVDEYKQISQAAQSDPQLMQRITKIFDDMQGQSQPGQAQPGQTKTE